MSDTLDASIEVNRDSVGGSTSGGSVSNLGYRSWGGRKVAGWTRWTVIAEVGIRRAWQSHWLRRMLLLAWLPAIWFGMGFFFWEQAVIHPGWRQAMVPFFHSMPPSREIEEVQHAVLTGELEGSRHTVWAGLLQAFFRYPQGVLMVMVIGLIAPPLISQDIRSRAFLLYFSRPLTRGEYLVGKLGSVWVYLAMISTIPALSLYVLGLLLSPTLEVFYTTWDIPLRVLGATVVLIVPTSVLALTLSSLTQESRYAGFAWFAIWVLGWFTFAAVTSTEAFNAQPEHIHSHAGRLTREYSVWTHLSLYHTLGRVQRWIFGFATFKEAATSVLILIIVSGLSLAVLFRRISAPMRA